LLALVVASTALQSYYLCRTITNEFHLTTPVKRDLLAWARLPLLKTGALPKRQLEKKPG